MFLQVCGLEFTFVGKLRSNAESVLRSCNYGEVGAESPGATASAFLRPRFPAPIIRTFPAARPRRPGGAHRCQPLCF